MPSAWLERREGRTGDPRYIVRYRIGGGETRQRYGGSFKTKRDALTRRAWIVGEMAAMRVPDIRLRDTTPSAAPKLAAAAWRWRQSRVDVAEATAIGHGVQLGRVMPHLGTRRVDEISTTDIAQLVATLHAAGYKRETIRKSVTVVAQVLDYAGIKDNPARDRVTVRLPREEREEPTPPSATQIEAVLPLMPASYALPPREDRDPDQPVFARVTQERMRIAINRACRAAGTPTWSPHDLRHRRISLWHRQGETWALIGARVGQRSLSVTADTYTHVLLDDRELDHARLAGEFRGRK